MNWFQGSISEAIITSRQRKCIFVVVVTTGDEASSQLLANLQDEQVARLFSDFVSVNFKNGSVEAQQFSQLYPLVVLPSIYMIGLQGVPLEVVGGLVDSATILSRAQKAVNLHKSQTTETPGPSQAAANTPPVTVHMSVPSGEPEATASLSEHVPEESLAASSPSATSSSPAPATIDTDGADTSGDSQPLLENRVERAKDLIEKLREKKAAEEREKEKASERSRRELGKQLQQLNESQREKEQQELVESRQREKREEKEALEKIRQQIAQDRFERSARYEAAKASEEERRRTAQMTQLQLQEERASAARNAFARLQFRLPDGSTRNEQFSSQVTLQTVKQFIDNEVKPPFKAYNLCTTYPRREFNSNDMNSSLSDLNLTPSAALLILPVNSSSSEKRLPSSGSSAASSWMRWILSPFYMGYTYLWWFLSTVCTPSVATIEADDDSGRSAGASAVPSEANRNESVRRRVRPLSNVRRLGDASADDSSDDNATWNGNSTQQL